MVTYNLLGGSVKTRFLAKKYKKYQYFATAQKFL